MKILLYSHSFLPAIGGRELVVHNLAIALTKLGHQPRVFGPMGWWRNRRLEFGYPVDRFPRLTASSLKTGKLSRRVREFEMRTALMLETSLRSFDVIHAHTTYPTGYIATSTPRVRSRLPIVVTPHGMDIHTIPDLGHGLRLDPELNIRIRDALRNADAVTAISEGIRDSAIEAGTPAELIRHVPNGVDCERFAGPAKCDVHEVLGIESGRKIIITIGNYNPRKGQETLLSAMPSVLAKDPDAVLVIVGRGSEALIPTIQQLGIEQRVVLTGPIGVPSLTNLTEPGYSNGSVDLVAALLRSSRVYVSAAESEGAEGLSLALLEAMAARTPVVATAISGNRDTVRNGENGFLVKSGNTDSLANAITEILEHPQLGVEMGRVGRDLVEREFSWRSVAERYVSIYRDVSRVA